MIQLGVGAAEIIILNRLCERNRERAQQILLFLILLTPNRKILYS